MKPRVLVLTPDFPPAFGGIQLLMGRLVDNWDRCDVRVVTLGSGGRRGVVLRVPRAPAGGQPAAIALLNAVAVVEGLRYKPDVVFSGHIVLGPAARAVKRLAGARYVQYAHGMEIPARPRLAATSFRAADAAVANSRYTAELAAGHGAEKSKLHRIPPGVDPRPPTDMERFEIPTVVTVSRLDERYKGHDVLLRAIPLVRALVPSARLLVVGDGSLRSAYEGLAHAFALDGAVEFVGAVGDEDRDQLLARSHVFAMPSRVSATDAGEGFGIAYLEAGTHGLPVVAGNTGGAPDAVLHGETGLLVDPTDHVAVADAISHLLLDPERAETMGRAGAERAKAFAWPLVAARVEDVILELAGKRA